MTRIERKLLVQNGALGVCLTLLVIAADWRGDDGLLAPMERWLYDERARQCQFSTPDPPDALVHIDIDDQAMQAIGPWPWQRSLLADITRLLDDAGARVVAWDVLFAERQKVRYEPIEAPAAASSDGASNGEPAPSDAATNGDHGQMQGRFRVIDDNAVFATALRRHGKTMLAAAFLPRQPHSPLQQATNRYLQEHLLIPTDNELREALIAAGFDPPSPPELIEARVKAWNYVMQQLVTDAIERGAQPAATPDGQDAVPSPEAVRESIWGENVWPVDRSFPLEIFEQEYRSAVAFYRLRRFSRARPPGLPPFTPVVPKLAPIRELQDAIMSSSFVDYLPDSDGVVRSVPLFEECNGRLYPQFGLMLACNYLGVDIDDVGLYPDRVVLPLADESQIVIPVHRTHVEAVGQVCGMFAPINWFGGKEWLTMYDGGDPARPSRHVSMLAVWDLLKLEQLRNKNLLSKAAHDSIGFYLHNFDFEGKTRLEQDEPDTADAWAAHVPAVDEINERAKEAESPHLMTDAAFEAFLAGLETDRDRTLFADLRIALFHMINLANMEKRYQSERRELEANVQGKAVIIGWTALGALDRVTTSIHPVCPGPVVHGVIFNNIVNRDVLTRASPWATRGITLVIGLLATIAVARLGPWRALITSILLLGGYLLLNGLVLFDDRNIVVGLAAPTVTIGLIWAACTLARFIVEKSERARITSRFRSYVDPALVNYVIDHPEKARLDGQVRELTVVFTDLAGFTTLGERLQERTVPLLNDFMSRMVPIVRDNTKPIHRRGYVNKFLGDGMMFFFGAPHDNESHALDAVTTVLRMQGAIPPFNSDLDAQGLPGVKMRVGVSTGRMVVGDAGSVDASDYTVLGDAVNLGARLESANKQTGTLILISERTFELVKDALLCRPIARLQVVGKSMGIMAYEPLVFHAEATPQQQQLADNTRKMVGAFCDGRFDECARLARQLQEDRDQARLTKVYLQLCEQYLAEPPGDDFDGTIVLTDK